MTDCLGCMYVETAPVKLDDGRAVCATCPVLHNLPEYPRGIVDGPCVCGSWPGGECLRCPVIPAKQ